MLLHGNWLQCTQARRQLYEESILQFDRCVVAKGPPDPQAGPSHSVRRARMYGQVTPVCTGNTQVRICAGASQRDPEEKPAQWLTS